ncbi:MAG: hypothetical protein L3K00_03175 [Thermoplasmata archaeon]|nr:hypothetical protein [Thermoplasmata archaeon]
MNAWIKSTEVAPLKLGVEPGLQVIVVLAHYPGADAIVCATVGAAAADRKRIGPVTPALISSGTQGYGLNLFRSPGKKIDEADARIEFHVPLTRREIDYLERTRDADGKKNVTLFFKFHVTFAVPRSTYRELPTAATNGQPGASAIVPGGNSSDELISFITEDPEGSKTIASSDWSQEYVTAFGLGTFLVLELPIPEKTVPTGDFKDRIERAVHSLDLMKQDLVYGEWTELVKHGRGVWDLMRNRLELAPVLLDSGLSQDAAESLLDAMGSLFNYASKFEKTAEFKSGVVNPVLKADREDAQFAYAVASTVVNLVARKVAKATG